MRIGSLFSGYGGLDLAVQSVLGGEIAWHVEYDKAPSRILDHHFPGVPNYGDVTQLDFTTVEPVDVLTAGYPCQPFSAAGLRKGTHDDRHLWPHVARAIRDLGPRIVVLENVRNHLTLGFDVVLADLARMGWACRWGAIRAADAGAPHNRARLFAIAYPDSTACDQRRVPASRQAQGGRPRADAGRRGGASIADADSAGSQGSQSAGRHDVSAWGDYGPAIARWQHAIGRAAPSPTEPGRFGTPRRSPAFVEWMMGLPAKWVTDPAIGISRNDQLKALGNGVVPQQAALALDVLLKGTPNDLRQIFATV